MRIIIVTPSLQEHDAIGNDIAFQKKLLENAGCEVLLYANSAALPYAGMMLERNELESHIQDPANLLIYHHSVNWEYGAHILKSMRAKCIVKYHNITPYEFFEPYDIMALISTMKGRNQTRAFAESGKVHRYFCDSHYNAREILAEGVRPEDVEVVPPFTRLDDFQSQPINQKLLEEQLDRKLNVLFVGRLVPNKGHRHLIETVSRYIDIFGDDIVLNVVGKYFPNGQFLGELEQALAEAHIGDRIRFIQDASFRDLKTYYISSHVFLLMSEHEGFCVPILEAQYNGLPIVALNRTAVKETLGSTTRTGGRLERVRPPSMLFKAEVVRTSRSSARDARVRRKEL